ncbi:MAG: 50S ribosomal protein L21 [bacterium]
MPATVILDIGGKQHSAAEGDTIKVEQVDSPAGGTITLDKVMAAVDGENSSYGAPYIEGAQVEAKILGHGRDKKIRVFKYKPKKRYRVLTGHRQNYSLIKIESIKLP